MPQRRRPSPGLGLAALIPWWVWLVLAALAYLVLHHLAGVSTTTGTPGERIGKALWVAAGGVGQYLVPPIFILGAFAAAALRPKRWRQDPTGGSSPFDPDDSPSKDRAMEEDLYATWKEVWGPQSKAPRADTTRWSQSLLHALEWKRFEIVCGGYFEKLGFRAQVAREGPDGGVDIHLYADGASAPGIVVQCKAWKVYRVGVKPIRELLGVMTAAGVGEGIFVTTGTFTREASEFAGGKNIHLVDGDNLLTKIAALSTHEQAELLQLATEVDFSTPTCPSCGVKMTERLATKSGERFWGCVNFPRCRRTFRFSN